MDLLCVFCRICRSATFWAYIFLDTLYRTFKSFHTWQDSAQLSIPLLICDSKLFLERSKMMQNWRYNPPNIILLSVINIIDNSIYILGFIDRVTRGVLPSMTGCSSKSNKELFINLFQNCTVFHNWKMSMIYLSIV